MMAASPRMRNALTLFSSADDVLCHRVRLVLAAKGVTYDLITVDPKDPPEDLIDLNPTVRAPDLAARVGRETADFKKDVRKLKELGLTESLAIGYLLSPRGQAVVDAGLPAPRERAPREEGTPLPRSIGAPATRALREVGVTTLEQVATHTSADLAAMHGVGPMAIGRLREAMAERGLDYAGD